MNDIRFAYKYQQMGYNLTDNKKDESGEKAPQNTVESSTEYKQYLNLPKNFKLGG